MRRLLHCASAGLFLMLAEPPAARAGMPTFLLNDVTRLRVQSLSFFLVVFLLSSWLIQRLWNQLQKDFPRLPRLSYGKALGLVTLWGFLFVLVLTMISGARELLTPGAWEKVGFTYRLTRNSDNPAPSAAGDAASEKERRQKLDNLRAALWEYSRTHDGKFPSDRSTPGVPPEAWRVSDPSGMQYVYFSGLSPGGAVPLAAEPEVYREYRFVLFANGTVCRLEAAEAARLLSSGGKPPDHAAVGGSGR